MKVVIVSFILFAIFAIQYSNASLCKPLSVFRIDCNICKCTSSGREYSCTRNICPPNSYDNFVQEQTKDGHIVLKPKPVNDKFDDDEFIFPRKIRKTRMPANYNDQFLEENRDSYEDSNRNFDDVSLEEDTNEWENDELVQGVLEENML